MGDGKAAAFVKAGESQFHGGDPVRLTELIPLIRVSMVSFSELLLSIIVPRHDAISSSPMGDAPRFDHRPAPLLRRTHSQIPIAININPRAPKTEDNMMVRFLWLVEDVAAIAADV